jgi:hypothetical protein
VGAGAAGGGENLLAHGVVHHCVLEPAFVLAGDRHREYRKLVQKVRRPVERIDDPHGIVVPAGTAFFRQKGVIRVVLADDRDDLRLRLGIDLGYEVVPALGRDREGFEAIEVADDDFAGPPRGPNGDIEKRMHYK